jgi:ketosteroid isomerase-like protein
MTFLSVARFAAITIVLILFVWAEAQPKAIVERPTGDDQFEVVQVVRAFFSALESGDDAQFMSFVGSDFYSYEGGIRFSGHEILLFIKAQRAAGRSYQWSVNDADVHVRGNIAWAAYVNRGRITDSSGTTDQSWLESAFLEKQKGAWKIVFLHSTRVPK